MNTINSKTLRAGHVFSAPVFVEDGNMLVPAGIPLRQKDIDFINTWDIETVETEGHITNTADTIFTLPPDSKPELEPEPVPQKAPAKMITPSAPMPVVIPKLGKDEIKKISIMESHKNSAPYRVYTNLIDKLDSIFLAIADRINVEMRIIDNISTQLIQELRDHRDNFIEFILGGEIKRKELAKNSLNTAILSALTAQELKLANHKILHIVMGSLLHDVGMLILPKEILEKRGGLSDSELKQIQNHPNFSAKIISKELFGPREVNLIALQHHERWDGKGYPEHTLGPDIDIGARIVSVADAFEAMVSNKSYRNSIVGYQAMKNLLSDNSRRFDPAVIRAFSKIMGIYPIGSIVMLNGELLARVVGIHPEAPLRPIIRMLLDEFGKVYKADEGKIVDLLNEKSLFIKNAIDLKDISGSNA
jgi:HD-GYP domain-containing protein (c-di-GMP phosphodiesterase class II)